MVAMKIETVVSTWKEEDSSEHGLPDLAKKIIGYETERC